MGDVGFGVAGAADADVAVAVACLVDRGICRSDYLVILDQEGLQSVDSRGEMLHEEW